MRRFPLLLALTALAALPQSASAIVGGTDAPAGKYPSVARVTFAVFGCTGTLVAPQWVMTAGHCSSITGGADVATPVRYPPQAFTVTVGGVQADGSDGEELTVDRLEAPPEYLFTKGYDITLLHLAAPARTAPTPIAGRGYGGLFAPGVLEEIVGFGTLESGGDTPDVVQQAKVPIVTDATCAAAYPPGPMDGFEAGTQICAGYPKGGVDSCQGDSGGPLYARTGADRLLLVGATSYGRGCAEADSPGVYARVADATLRDGFVRPLAPETIVDAAPGDVTTPMEVFDPATGTVRPGTTPATAPPAADAPAPAREPAGAEPTAPAAGGDAPATAPATTTTTGPEGMVVASRAPGGFGAAVEVRRVSRAALRSRGVPFRLSCSAACTARVRLVVDARTARRMGLRSRTLGTVAVTRRAAGTTARTLRVRGTVLRRALARPGAALTLVAPVVPAGGGATSTLSARVLPRGR